MWFGRGSDVGRRWLGRVFGSGADSLAEVKRESGFQHLGQNYYITYVRKAVGFCWPKNSARKGFCPELGASLKITLR